MTNLPPAPEGMDWVWSGGRESLPPPPEGMEWVQVGDSEGTAQPATAAGDQVVVSHDAGRPHRWLYPGSLLIIDLVILVLCLWLLHLL